ncbi:MAG: TolC family protein [Myxococcota bacterium]
MKAIGLGVLASALLFATHAHAQRNRTPPNIAVVAEGPADTYNRVTGLLKRELQELFGENFAFPDSPTHVGDFTEERATTLVNEVLADRDIDLVIGFGIYIGRAVGQVERLDKPVFLPFAAPQLQSLPRDGDRSGRANLSYLTGLVNLETELRRFRDVVRRPKAAIVIDRYIVEAIPNLAGFVRTVAGDSMEIQLVPVDPPAEAILSAIPADTQAVYLGPLIRLPQSEEQALIDGINARRIPSYASEGRSWVERGAFTSLVPADEETRRMRRVALNIQETLTGEDPARFSTAFEQRTELVINMATARQIGVWPRFELMTEAVLLGSENRDQRGREITLRSAVDEAVRTNLNLEATRQDIAIARQQVREARGAWLPTVDANADFTWTDPDVTSTLQSAERELSWGVSGSQVVYSAQIHQGIRAQRANERAARAGVHASRLDIVQSAAEAYLNVLRARTSERVNRENLQRIRRNLALAEVRVDIGSAGREEVFRWEIEIADGRATVISASAARNQAEIALNRVMNRDRLEESFRPVEPTEPDSSVILDERVAVFVEDPWSFRVLREFVAEEAIRNSPEIQQLDAAIEAQSHALTGLRQRLFVPDILVSAGFTHVFRRAGSGSGQAPPIMGVDIPERDNFTWQVGAGLRLRLFDAARFPEIQRAQTTVGQLEIQRRATAQAVEQRVRSAMHQAGSSRAAVRLRNDAAEAAEQNLSMVTDAYRRGTVNVITLIDAQNQALVTRLAAANAVYDFMVDFIGVERASGAFGFRMSADERNDFVQRLQRFAAEQQRAEGEEQ